MANLDLPNHMMIYDTVNISRLKVDSVDDPRITWSPPPPLVYGYHQGTNYVIERIGNGQHKSDGTNLESQVKWEG